MNKDNTEKLFVKIGGIRQGMFIKEDNSDKPILLYIHGGPCFPNYFLFEKYNPGLEKYFKVCYWEQRGGGLSYSKDVNIKTITFDQLTLDAIEVTNWLRKRYNCDKIYLMAHSGGTPIALMAAKKHPELYYAYMAMAQITNQRKSEEMAIKYMIDKSTQMGDKKAINRISKYFDNSGKIDVDNFFKSSERDEYMHSMGIGTMRNMKSVISGVFIPSLLSRSYTIGEKWKLWKSKFSFLPKTGLHKELLSKDFTSDIDSLDIPIYFFVGKYDYTVNYILTEAYYQNVKAPKKGLFVFENSAHSPLFEEPNKFLDIIKRHVLTN